VTRDEVAQQGDLPLRETDRIDHPPGQPPFLHFQLREQGVLDPELLGDGLDDITGRTRDDGDHMPLSQMVAHQLRGFGIDQRRDVLAHELARFLEELPFRPPGELSHRLMRPAAEIEDAGLVAQVVRPRPRSS